MRRVDTRAVWGGALLLGCAERGLPEENANREKERSELSVQGQVVAAVQQAGELSAEAAFEVAREDALLAAELRRREPTLARWIERLALTRALLRELGEEAKAQGGPPSDAEVLALSERRFWELDRPRMVQVTHAVVMSADENPAARALAERILLAVTTSKSATEFRAAAKAVTADGLEVKIESLPPVTLDGRAVDPDQPPPAGPPVQSFDRDFAIAAHRLEQVGQLSPVVRTPFGYHVLQLVRTVPPLQFPLEERRQRLKSEILGERASALQTELLARQRQAATPQQERSALRSMESVALAP